MRDDFRRKFTGIARPIVTDFLTVVLITVQLFLTQIFATEELDQIIFQIARRLLLLFPAKTRMLDLLLTPSAFPFMANLLALVCTAIQLLFAQILALQVEFLAALQSLLRFPASATSLDKTLAFRRTFPRMTQQGARMLAILSLSANFPTTVRQIRVIQLRILQLPTETQVIARNFLVDFLTGHTTPPLIRFRRFRPLDNAI